MSLQDARVLVVGGSSGIGMAIAKLAAEAGATVMIAGRTPVKLQAAITCMGGEAMAIQMDVTDEEAVKRGLEAAGELDHLVVTAADVTLGPVRSTPTEQAMAAFNSKFWGQYRCAKHACVKERGSITFTSGLFATRPVEHVASLAAINAGIEGLTRALALELAPTRVNCLSPGLTQTPRYDAMPEAVRDAMFKEQAERLPVGRITQPEDVAQAAVLLMTNPAMTGQVININGGGELI